MAFRRSSISISTLACVIAAGMSVKAQDPEPMRPESPSFPMIDTITQPAPAKTEQVWLVKLNNDEQKRADAIFELVDKVASGKTPAPADVTLSWTNHFLRAGLSRTYVPFVIDVEPGKFTSFPVVVYLRLVSRDQPAAAPVRGQNPPAQQEPSYAWSDGYFVTKDLRVTRFLQASPGDYDLYVAMQEKADRNVKQPKTVVMKRTLRLPDFGKDFTASDIIMADSLEPTAKQLSPAEELEQPYTLGGLKIMPSRTNTFKKSGELAFAMFIYNEGVAADDKPDVQVEYNFYQKTDGAEKFFNKTAPQLMNAQTLPPEFKVSAGHQISAIQGIPLGSFPEGDYRLEIKVMDKALNKTLSQSANFTVTAS